MAFAHHDPYVHYFSTPKGEYSPEPSYRVISEKVSEGLGPQRSPGPAIIMQILREMGLRGRREAGPKGAWWFACGNSAEEFRGTSKAANAILSQVKRRLQMQGTTTSLPPPHPAYPPTNPSLHYTNPYGHAPPVAPPSYSMAPMAQQIPMSQQMPGPSYSYVNPQHMLPPPLPLDPNLLMPSSLPPPSTSYLPHQLGTSTHGSVPAPATNSHQHNAKHATPKTDLSPPCNGSNHNGPSTSSKEDKDFQHLCQSVQVVLRKDLEEQAELQAKFAMQQATAKRKRDEAELAVQEVRDAEAHEAGLRRRLELLNRRIKVQQEAISLAEEEEDTNAADTLLFGLQGRPQ